MTVRENITVSFRFGHDSVHIQTVRHVKSSFPRMIVVSIPRKQEHVKRGKKDPVSRTDTGIPGNPALPQPRES